MKKNYLLFCIILTFSAFGQAPGDIAQSFGSFLGFNDNIQVITLQTDGKILVGGEFTSYNGATENSIIRLNADGTKDTSFNTGTGFNNLVFTIKSQTDGKILVGGLFTSYNGGSENYIIRLNADGTKDTSFNTGTGFNPVVYEIEQQADGKILVGGQFTSYNGVTENYIIRLNADGTKDTSFITGTGFNNSVFTIKPQTDGKILVGGQFTSYNGVTENYIIRLNADGTKDTSFNTGTGISGTVREIEKQADGKILVGGTFTSFNGVTENRIIRLNADGTKDISFITGTGFNSGTGSFEVVFTIEQQADGKILVGGEFTSYNGVTENNIIRLNADGTKDTSFNTGIGFNVPVVGYYNGTVNSIFLQADGKILVGGDFTSYKGVNENRIIRLNADGSKDTSLIFNTGTGFNNEVNTIKQQADGKIIVGGGFTFYNGGSENYIIRLNADGTKDTSFNTGTGFNGSVFTIEQQTDGKILVGGWFSSFNGVTENRIIRLNTNGTKDTSFITGTGFNSSGINIIKQQTDGKILIGGFFLSYNGGNARMIIRLNTDGTKDTSFNAGTGFNSNVLSIEELADGKILVGGKFTSYNGISENSIIRLNADGTKDTSFNTGTGFNFLGGVWKIEQQTDGKILVGGGFTSYNGVTENYIIRLNADGTKDTSFNTGTGFNSNVLSIEELADGKILVGGGFTSYNGVTENRIIRLNADGTKDTSFNTGTGFDGSVWTIKQQSDGKILVGGYFITYKGNNSSSHLIGLQEVAVLDIASFTDGNSFVLYPNPVKDLLYIKSNDFSSIKNIKIIDLQGKLIIEDANETINVNSLSKGLYIIKVITEEGEFTKKFIKE